MHNEVTHLDEIQFIGMSIRTNNQDEQNQETAKIGPLVGRYFSQQLAEQIPNRINPGVTLCVYTDYESDEHGQYTYFIGEAVSSIDEIPEGFTSKKISAGKFTKFTTEPGPMPMVVIKAWQHIWGLSSDGLGGQRNYLADFEVYDQRAADPSNSVVDLYIGVK